MTLQPRSQALIHYHGVAAGASAAFVSPAENVTLVKSAVLHNNGSVQTDVRLLVGLSDVPVTIIGPVVTLQAGASGYWEGWFVLNPGDYVQVQSTASGVDALVSGAVLNGPPLFPPAAGAGLGQLPSPDVPIATPRRPKR